jgi:hypothetical protein
MTARNIDLYQKAVTNLVALILAMNLVSCAAVQNASPYVTQPGYVEPVRWTAVYQGVRDAMMGNTSSLILWNAKNLNVMFAWPRAQGWAWIVLNTRYSAHNAIHAAGGAGNLMSCPDFSCLIKGAEQIGYRQITATDLVKAAPGFANSVVQQTVTFAANALTSIVVMPIGVAPADPWAEATQ